MSTSEDRTSGASATAEQQAPGRLGSELCEGYAELGDQRLHYVETGEGRGTFWTTPTRRTRRRRSNATSRHGPSQGQQPR